MVAVNVVYRLGLQVAIDNHMVAASSPLATEVLPNLLPGRWAEFAFGMVAAHVYVRGSVSRIASPFGWALLPLVPLAVLSVGSPLEHILFGGVFFLLLCIVLSGGNLIARILSWRPLVTLGVMSYSIYLVHQPIVVSLAHLLHQTGASPLLVFVEIVLLIPAILGVAWLLFITVERRTLHSSRTTPELGSPEVWLLAPLRLLRRSRPAELGWRPGLRLTARSPGSVAAPLGRSAGRAPDRTRTIAQARAGTTHRVTNRWPSRWSRDQ